MKPTYKVITYKVILGISVLLLLAYSSGQQGEAPPQGALEKRIEALEKKVAKLEADIDLLTQGILELAGKSVSKTPRFDRYYPVPFGDWVIVWLKAMCTVESQDYYVNIVPLPPQPGRARFRINILYSNTSIGREWYNTIGSALPDLIGRECQRWKLQGYPISLSDFEFVVQKTR